MGKTQIQYIKGDATNPVGGGKKFIKRSIKPIDL
jgi:hypothetical protein